MKKTITSTCDGNIEIQTKEDYQIQKELPYGPILFTLDNMVDLLTAYNAYLMLEDMLRVITEIDPSRGLLRDLRKLDDLLQDLSPVFNPDADYYEQEYWKIIANKELNIQDKARLLMGDCSFSKH